MDSEYLFCDMPMLNKGKNPHIQFNKKLDYKVFKE